VSIQSKYLGSKGIALDLCRHSLGGGGSNIDVALILQFIFNLKEHPILLFHLEMYSRYHEFNVIPVETGIQVI